MSCSTRFSDIAEVIMGQSPKALNVNNENIGLPLLNGPTEFSERHPVPVQFTKSGNRFAEKGDILFCVRGSTTGRMNYADQRYAIGRGIGAIRGTNGFPTPYVRAVLEQNLDRLLQAATGSTFPNVSRDMLNSLEVNSVGVNAAKTINRFLVALEDKVYLNSKINQTLEQIAQALFKSWFVDFDPVKAKIAVLEAGGLEEEALLAAMQVISSKNAEELAAFKLEKPEEYAQLQATAELFPAAMVESELGEIPEGWEVRSLLELVELIGGGTPKRSETEYWGGDIYWFSIKDLPEVGNVFVIDTEEKITEAGLKGSSTKILPLGATIITARGTVGKLALTGVSTAMNQSCYGVVGKNGTGPYLNYLGLSNAIEALERNVHGAVFDTITRNTFATVRHVQATLEIRQHFEALITPLFESIKSNLFQAKALSEMRDVLLPKLLSGELDVSELADSLEVEA